MSTKETENIYDKILYRASRQKRTIGIAIDVEGNPERFYKEALDYSIVVPVKDVRELVSLLAKGKVEGIVRGLPRESYVLYDELSKYYRFHKIIRCSIIRDVCGRYFFFGPTGLTEGNDFQSRMEYIQKVTTHMKNFDIKDPSIALLSLTHVDEATYLDTQETKGKKINSADKKIVHMAIKSDEETKTLFKHFDDLGYNIKYYENNIEKALKDGADFIVPANGLIGNAISRALWLVDHRTVKDKARLISLQLLTEGFKWVCEDTSSSEDDFSTHIIAATAWLNKPPDSEK